jgi:predicted transcriptional regulator
MQRAKIESMLAEHNLRPLGRSGYTFENDVCEVEIDENSSDAGDVYYHVEVKDEAVGLLLRRTNTEAIRVSLKDQHYYVSGIADVAVLRRILTRLEAISSGLDHLLARLKPADRPLVRRADALAEIAGTKPYTVVGRYLDSQQMWVKQVYARDPDEAVGLAIIDLVKSNHWDCDRVTLENWLRDIQAGEVFEGQISGWSYHNETGLVSEHPLVVDHFGLGPSPSTTEPDGGCTAV